MPRDQRLYMTFPIEFPEHPKVKPLSKAAKWDFVEMNAYSRRLGLNGIIPATVALKMWPKRSLTELINSHPTRPLVILVDAAYILRDYADHQLTTDDIEDLRDKRARAGQAGGKARAQNKQNASKAQASASDEAKQKLAPAQQIEAESESESGLENYQDIHLSGQVPNRPSSLTDDSHSVEALCTQQAANLGVDFIAVKTEIGKQCGRFPDPTAVMRIIAEVLERAKPPIAKPTGLVLSAVRNDWAEWQKRLDQEVA